MYVNVHCFQWLTVSDYDENGRLMHHSDADIHTKFILRRVYYFFIHCNHRRRNSNTHKSGSTTSLCGAPWSNSSLSVDLKKRGKGRAY